MEPMWCGAWWFELLVLGRRYACLCYSRVSVQYSDQNFTRAMPGLGTAYV